MLKLYPALMGEAFNCLKGPGPQNWWGWTKTEGLSSLPRLPSSKERGFLCLFSLFALVQKLWTQGESQLYFVLLHLDIWMSVYLWRQTFQKSKQHISNTRGTPSEQHFPFLEFKHADILEERRLTLGLLVPPVSLGRKNPVKAGARYFRPHWGIPEASHGRCGTSIFIRWQYQGFKWGLTVTIVLSAWSRAGGFGSIKRQSLCHDSLCPVGGCWQHGGRRHRYRTCYPTEAQELTERDTIREKETVEILLLMCPCVVTLPHWGRERKLWKGFC